ncbi:hypothetical protein Pelo_18273 [Pelomyxa schiedti]|nr:hypothetical protein Pelo_18273 [Pelomyxa schiedti]
MNACQMTYEAYASKFRSNAGNTSTKVPGLECDSVEMAISQSSHHIGYVRFDDNNNSEIVFILGFPAGNINSGDGPP